MSSSLNALCVHDKNLMIMTQNDLRHQTINAKATGSTISPSRVERAQSQINLYCQSALGFPGLGGGAKQPWDKMTVLEALAILEAAVLECKKREVDTPELRAAL